MPNYWIGATGRYYFPGLYTAVLPMIPGIYAIVRLARLRTRGMDDRVPGGDRGELELELKT
jgi:hypothetical protein